MFINIIEIVGVMVKVLLDGDVVGLGFVVVGGEFVVVGVLVVKI